MASVPGGQYSFFANGQNVNVVDPSQGGFPPPIPGAFNLAVMTPETASTPVPSTYQGVALLLNDGKTLDMVSGSYGV